MKFLCEQCKAKYQISDDKVAGKTVRMKCRKCGHMIEVRAEVTETSVAKGLPGSPASNAPNAQKPGQPKAGGLATSLSAAARPAAPRATVPSARPAQPSALAGAFQKNSKSEESSLDAFGANEWYVAINGVPVGPVRVSELRRKAALGVVTEDSLVWQEGLEEWRPVRAVTELAGLVREAIARPSLVTPPPGDIRQSQPPPSVGPPASRAPSRPSAGIAPRAYTATSPQPFAPTGPSEASKQAAAASSRNNVVPFASRLATAEKFEPAPNDGQQQAARASLVAADPFALPPPPAGVMQSGITSSPLGVANANTFAASGSAVAVAEPAPAAKGPPNWIAITMIVLAASLGITAPIAYFFKPAPLAPTPVVITMSAAPQPLPVPVAAAAPTDSVAAVASAAPEKSGVIARNTGGGGGAKPPTAAAGGAKIDLGGLIGGPGSGPNGGPTGGGAGSSGSSLSGSAIESVVRSHAAGVKRTCWERGANQEASENVTVRVVIGGGGAVQSASASGGSDPAMSKCIENSVRSWQFPPSGGTTNVDIPFHFVRQ